MEITKVELDGMEFRLFYIDIKGEQVVVAEEKLEIFMQKAIQNDRWSGKIRDIDERYGYYVDQDIADREDEDEIRESILDIMD